MLGKLGSSQAHCSSLTSSASAFPHCRSVQAINLERTESHQTISASQRNSRRSQACKFHTPTAPRRYTEQPAKITPERRRLIRQWRSSLPQVFIRKCHCYSTYRACSPKKGSKLPLTYLYIAHHSCHLCPLSKNHKIPSPTNVPYLRLKL